MTTLPTSIHPNSLLASIYQHRPLITSEGKHMLRQIPFQRWDPATEKHVPTPAIIASVDNGNDALKLALLHAHEPFLQTQRLVTAYSPARTIRGGEGITTWQVNDSEPFWIAGDALLAKKAESLPIGMTNERLPDARYQRFLNAALVELLRTAGYGTHEREFQGEYDLFLAFGVPNEEMTLNGPKEAIRHALRSILNNVSKVSRTDEQGKITIWYIRLVEITPYAQTFGSFLTWFYTLEGKPVETDIVKHVTLDIGGGHFHASEVDIMHQAQGRPKLRLTASLLGDGTIAIARAASEAIRVQYPGIRLSDVEAQQTLTSGVVTIGGRSTSVKDLVAEILITRSQNLFTQMLPFLQVQDSFLLFTGGGSILLAQSLEQLVQTKRNVQGFLLIPKDLASVLNAIGGYVLAQSVAQRMGEHSLLQRRDTHA